MLASNGGWNQKQFQRQKKRIRPAILVRPGSGTGTGAKVLVLGLKFLTRAEFKVLNRLVQKCP